MKLKNQRFIFSWASVSLCIFITSCGQTPVNEVRDTVSHTADTLPIVGGGCDGCEIMYVGMPADIDYEDESPAWNEEGEKIMIHGTVFQLDGKTPAKDVILYYWHTDHKGYYSQRDDQDPKAKIHGHIRGWIKTGADGGYVLMTSKPAPYPDGNNPAHIHWSIKEPDVANEYYIDDCFWDNDPVLTEEKRNKLEDRGGNGVLTRGVQADGYTVYSRDIILGLNIPHYRKK